VPLFWGRLFVAASKPSRRFRPCRARPPAAAVSEHAVAAPPLPAPACLTSDQRADWDDLVRACPGRFGAADSPLLRELIRHAAIARKLAGELATMESKSLTASTKAGAATRTVYLQLATATREEAKIVASLAVKLRIARTTAVRKLTDEAERRKTPTGPRPWDQTGQRDDFN
jgi:hypothetical protein